MIPTYNDFICEIKGSIDPIYCKNLIEKFEQTPERHEKGNVVRVDTPAHAGARLRAKLALLGRQMVVHMHVVIVCLRP